MQKQNKRDIKKNRKKIQSKYQPQVCLTVKWFNKTFEKVFNQKKYSQLFEYMTQNDDNLEPHLKLERFQKRNELTNNLIDNILSNKFEIKRLFNYLLTLSKTEYYNRFQKYIYLPYNVVGNKHHLRFDEYYNFISKFSLSDMGIVGENVNQEITLFRVMDEEEYINIKNGGGVESPSFTTNPFYLQFLRGNNSYMDITRKSVFVLCNFNIKDCIVDYVISGESEVVMKKGSKPTLLKKFNEYGIEEVKSDLGEGVIDFLPLTTNELNNGFTYMDGLMSKGYDLSENYQKSNGQWIRQKGKKSSDWINSYYKSLDEVLSEFGNHSNGHIIQTKNQLNQIRNLGDRVLNNPLI